MPMGRRAFLSLASLLACAFAVRVPAPAGAQHGVPSAPGAMVRSAHAIVRSENGVVSGRAATVASEVDRLFTLIGHDLADTPPRLRLHLYASHVTFARALQSLQGSHPQSSMDNTSTIVRNTLLLGPLPASFLQHNLAHVYTEWIIDRLTGNRTDALPSTPWLYDGLAEFEAYRYEPAGLRCALKGPLPLDITIVRTARQWMSIRSGPLGALEYCLAYAQTHNLVKHIGWSNIQRTLHRGWAWPAVAQHLLAAKRATAP
jgi:hypothetical protein